MDHSSSGLAHFKRCPKMSVSGDCGMFLIEYIQAILRVIVWLLNFEIVRRNFNPP
jgi:hypothetical protein